MSVADARPHPKFGHFDLIARNRFRNVQRRFKRLIALFEASFWVGAAFVLLNAAGLLDTIPVKHAAGIGTIAGEILVGIGAFVNKACIFGTDARLGSGELSCLAGPLGFHLGSLVTAYLPAPAQLDDRSPLIAASICLAVLVIPLIFVRIYMHLRQMRGTGRGLWLHIWSPHVATTIIGITFLLTTVTEQIWMQLLDPISETRSLECLRC